MASEDAEMPSRYKLGEDLKQIKEDIAGLRGDVEGLAGDVAKAGSHQIANLQALGKTVVAEVEAAVKRNPLSALAIAAGAGFLYEVLTRR